ncbi:hypothetical protein Trydic_g14935 [Trypoxylus dichotomus]
MNIVCTGVYARRIWVSGIGGSGKYRRRSPIPVKSYSMESRHAGTVGLRVTGLSERRGGLRGVIQSEDFFILNRDGRIACYAFFLLEKK